MTSCPLGELGVLERELLRSSDLEREFAAGVSAGREFAVAAALERVLRLGPEPSEFLRSGSLECLSRFEFFGIAFPSKSQNINIVA